jgi:hypothetical protein
VDSAQGSSAKIGSILTQAGVQPIPERPLFFVAKALDEGKEERAIVVGKKLAGMHR